MADNQSPDDFIHRDKMEDQIEPCITNEKALLTDLLNMVNEMVE